MHWLLDLLYPPHCVSCRRTGSVVCEECLGQIKVYDEYFPCPGCGSEIKQFSVCMICPEIRSLDGIFVAAPYVGVLEEMIHAYKYDMITELGTYLVAIITQALKSAGSFRAKEKLFVVPVPMHSDKIVERGFNQANVLAKFCVPVLGGEAKELLQKVRTTPAQMTLTKADRFANVADLYQIKSPDVVQGFDVFLIDDVMTSGATLNECAKVLKAAGARYVYAAVLAHGS